MSGVGSGEDRGALSPRSRYERNQGHAGSGGVRLGGSVGLCAAIRFWGAGAILLLTASVAALGSEHRGLYVVAPFHPEECEAAFVQALQQIQRDPGSERWKRVCAEAQLCAGVRDHNPRLLRMAADEFRRLSIETPDLRDQHLAMGLADALRLLYPASSEAIAALEDALAMAPDNARSVRSYLESNVAAVRANAAGCNGRPDPPESYLDVCVHRGPAEIESALTLLEKDRAQLMDDIDWMRERAELLIRAGRLAEAVTLHREAVRRLIHSKPRDPRLQPSTQRVDELTRMQATTFRCRPTDDEHGGSP